MTWMTEPSRSALRSFSARNTTPLRPAACHCATRCNASSPNGDEDDAPNLGTTADLVVTEVFLRGAAFLGAAGGFGEAALRCAGPLGVRRTEAKDSVSCEINGRQESSRRFSISLNGFGC